MSNTYGALDDPEDEFTHFSRFREANGDVSSSRSSANSESPLVKQAPIEMTSTTVGGPGAGQAFHTDEGDYLMEKRKRRSRRMMTDDDENSICSWIMRCCRRKKELKPRVVKPGRLPTDGVTYPRNIVRNQKYSFINFVPLVLFEQFSFFLNFYFLIMAFSQLIPEIRVGSLYTTWGPLCFVIAVTMIREAVDDLRRYRRDLEVNGARYQRVELTDNRVIPSSDIRVGDLIVIEKNQRVPADMILMQTSESAGSSFIRTDQLDGETDWKLRLAVPTSQNLPLFDRSLLELDAHVYAEQPKKDIHSFTGTFTKNNVGAQADEFPLNVENILWANTVVASATCVGLVVYTGIETRSVMNTSKAKCKVGLLDLEINTFTKILFAMVIVLSFIMMILKGFGGPWYRYFFRFIVLFSYIIPISLRVNLDMGKVVYSWLIQRDEAIPGTVVRSTTIPEELGRIQYLLSDKTGTLTQNEMVFKRLHLGTMSFNMENMDDLRRNLCSGYEGQGGSGEGQSKHRGAKVRRTNVTRVLEATKALAICHNVTPVWEDEVTEGEMDVLDGKCPTYQAASPDEVALVTWSESVGLTLIRRELDSMTLRHPSPKGQGKFTTTKYQILQVFPFTSESKRMGIITKDLDTNEICFYMKGADGVMQNIVQYNDWLEEECGNMARDGLRTLVVAGKTLTEEYYQDFASRYHQAKMSVNDRSSKMNAVVLSLEQDLNLLGLTGVEDKLQEGVQPTLELLRNAGIKIWMLTGDKLETATCIAKSSKLVSRTQQIHTFKNVTDRENAHLELNAFRRKNNCALVISGESLSVILKYYEIEFVELACQCPAVVVCRCSPTQKADIVKLLKTHTQKSCCAIGDGGNDVSMIQEADAGVGIVGKEGRQASLAADFSINQFSHLGRLLMVHGRNSYKSSASLSQFVIHRGLIISTMQAVFSSVFYFSSIPLFPGFLMVGYATVFTMFPVFSMVLDKDVEPEIAMTYPELYKELTKGRTLNYKTFFMWVLISIYQGGVLIYGAILLFESDFIHVVAIAFTSLILTELLMVALTIRTWHVFMIVGELLSLLIYFASLFIFRESFDSAFLATTDFLWKVIVITSVSCIPLYVLKFLQRKFSPPSYAKVTS